MVRWRDVRRQHKGALLAEDAQTDSCAAHARLWRRPQGPKPWVVEFRVDCQGRKPWVYVRTYTNLPAAVACYLKRRDLATERLAHNS